MEGVEAAVDDVVNCERPCRHHAEVAHLAVCRAEVRAEGLEATAAAAAVLLHEGAVQAAREGMAAVLAEEVCRRAGRRVGVREQRQSLLHACQC